MKCSSGCVSSKSQFLLNVRSIYHSQVWCQHSFTAYSVFCVDLAHEYIKLGRPKRAGSIFNRCATVFKVGTVTDEVRLRHLLGQAEILALGENIPGRCVHERYALTLILNIIKAQACIARHTVWKLMLLSKTRQRLLHNV